MSPFRKGLVRLLNALPAIILVTFIEVIIVFATAALVMLELMPIIGQTHPGTVLVLAVITAIGTHFWIVFNHKIRAYIKARSSE
jgi:divalent metal cation (Fe/Co/Zn/Cd) transporter